MAICFRCKRDVDILDKKTNGWCLDCQTNVRKVCNQCHKELPASSFWRNSTRANGLQTRCKVCQDKYRKTNEQKAKRVLRAMRWNRSNPDRYKASMRRWLDKNPGRFRKYWESYYPKNKERYHATGREWRKANRVKNHERIRQWQKEHQSRVSQYAKRRRDLECKAEGSITDAEAKFLFDKYGNRCLACAKHESDLKYPLQLDHIVPLTCGGSNSINNRQPLCKSCNSKKRQQTIDYRPKE